LPKQLLALVGRNTLIQDTVLRTLGTGFSAPIIICGEDHRFLIAEQLRVSGAQDAKIILEPAGRNTAPAAAIAALTVLENDPEGVVLLAPSDHIVRDAQAFQSAVAIAAQAAHGGALVTFGICPSRPETGYGYIKRGAPLSGIAGAFQAERFVEKPEFETAKAYLDDGGYYWNSGMFLFSAKAFLAEMERLEPDMLVLCRSALSQSHKDLDFIRLGVEPFLAAPSQSIDYAIIEHARNTVVVPVEMGWSDVGSWQSLWEISEHAESGNVVQGDVVTENVKNSYIRSEGPLVAVIGLENLVVVATKDAVLVSHRDASQDVKKIVECLQETGRHHHIHHTVIHRPWGSYENIDAGDGYRVKRIEVKPSAKLSLQSHQHRAEYWTVVSGVALVTCDDQRFEMKKNQSTFIPQGAKHRLENPGSEPLHLIEVQSGSYLGEDDIVRFEDSYGRVGKDKSI
jgi:mannose-1-phosphate guanylyltransferase/mannose-6-phosphate isomerase